MRKPTREQISRARWLRGRLNYKLHAGQHLIRKAYDSSKNQLFVGECSRQFGKTIFEAILALEKAFSKPKAKVKIGTAFHTDLLEFIIPAFEVVMEDCPDDLRPVWKSQKSKFVIPHNGSEIKLIGLDRKPNGLRGTVIDLIILSEAGFIGNLHYLFKSVIIPATTHRPDCRVVMLSTPPETPAHNFLDYVQKAQIEGGHIKLTIYENPLLNQKTIERLMSESGGEHSTTWRREYLCEHITDANLQIIADWKKDYVLEMAKEPQHVHYHKYVAMDLGVRDHTAILFGYYDYLRAILVVEDEFIINGPDMTTKILQGHIKRKELQVWSSDSRFNHLEREMKLSEDHIRSIEHAWENNRPKVHYRISDNNNPLLLQDLSHMHALHFLPTDKGRLEEMVNTVRMLVRSAGLVVHPRCKSLAGCLEYGVWDKNRDKFAKSDVYGHFDALAALIYLVRNLNRSTNPIPPDFNYDRDNQILFRFRHESTTERSLKSAFSFKG